MSRLRQIPEGQGHSVPTVKEVSVIRHLCQERGRFVAKLNNPVVDSQFKGPVEGKRRLQGMSWGRRCSRRLSCKFRPDGDVLKPWTYRVPRCSASLLIFVLRDTGLHELPDEGGRKRLVDGEVDCPLRYGISFKFLLKCFDHRCSDPKTPLLVWVAYDLGVRATERQCVESYQ